MTNAKQLLTSKQAADILRVERSTVVRRARRKEIPVAASHSDARGDQFLFDPDVIAAIARDEITARREALAKLDGAA